MSDEEIPSSKLAAAILRIRNAQAELTRKYDDEYGALSEKREKIELELLKRMQANGEKSVNFDGIGTATQYQSIKASIADDSLFFGWIKENDALDALERRVRNKFVEEYIENNNGVAPPGLNVFSEIRVQIRKAPAK